MKISYKMTYYTYGVEDMSYNWFNIEDESNTDFACYIVVLKIDKMIYYELRHNVEDFTTQPIPNKEWTYISPIYRTNKKSFNTMMEMAFKV